MAQSDKEISSLGEFFRKIQEGRFEEAWQDDNWELFQKFMEEKAIPAGGFLLTLNLAEGGFVWIVCKWHKAEVRDSKLYIKDYMMEVAIPNDGSKQECPDAWKNYPVIQAPTII